MSASLRSSSSLGAWLSLLIGGKGLGLVGVLGPFCPAGETEAQHTQLKSQAGTTGLPGWLHLAAGRARQHLSLRSALGTRLLHGSDCPLSSFLPVQQWFSLVASGV